MGFSGGLFLKYTDAPGWVRWLICAIPLGVSLVWLGFGRFWPWGFAVGGLLVIVNLYLLFDHLFPRQRPEDEP